MTIKQRLAAPTPPFFRKLRNICLAAAAIGGSVLALPVALPAIVGQVAGYLAVAGTVATTICQATTADKKKRKQANGQ